MEFEWDEVKAASNLFKHGVSFAEAMTIFGDAFEVTIHDPVHSTEEMRFVSIGLSEGSRLPVISYTDRDQRIRIISARGATPKERKQYESKRRS